MSGSEVAGYTLHIGQPSSEGDGISILPVGWLHGVTVRWLHGVTIKNLIGESGAWYTCSNLCVVSGA